jgi:hypothetical protein
MYPLTIVKEIDMRKLCEIELDLVDGRDVCQEEAIAFGRFAARALSVIIPHLKRDHKKRSQVIAELFESMAQAPAWESAMSLPEIQQLAHVSDDSAEGAESFLIAMMRPGLDQTRH